MGTLILKNQRNIFNWLLDIWLISNIKDDVATEVVKSNREMVNIAVELCSNIPHLSTMSGGVLRELKNLRTVALTNIMFQSVRADFLFNAKTFDVEYYATMRKVVSSGF